MKYVVGDIMSDMTREEEILQNQAEKEMYEQYIQFFKNSGNKPTKVILNLYKGNVVTLIKACVCLIFQRSPAWVIPVVTANIVNIATNTPKNAGRFMLVQVFIALIFLLQNVGSSYLATRYFSKVNRNIEGSLRNVLIRKLQYLSIMFHKGMQSGRLQSKVMRDVENIYELLNQIFKTLLFFALDFAIIIIICAKKSPLVLLFFVLVVPVAVFLLYRFRKPVSVGNKEYRRKMEETQGAVAQMIEMIPVTRAHGLQEVEIGKMNYYLNGIVKKGYHLDLVNSIFAASNWVTFQVMQLLCLAFTATLALKGKISIGEVILYQTYFTQLVGQFSTLINIYPAICKGFESVRSINDILEDNDLELNNAIIPLGKLKGKVEFRNVFYQYNKDDKMVLNNFNMVVSPGESIALVGESGGGKSTVLNLLIGFMQPTQGRLLIDGINMSNLDMEEYRSQIAVVPQNTILFDGTVKENIVYGMNEVSDEAVLHVIEEVGLEDIINELPQGIHTLLGQHGDKLSGGQKQRISIARALIRKPSIVILDEATSALDNNSELLVQRAMEKVMKTATTFVVAHRLSTIRNVDRILVLKHGEVVESGSYKELMEKQGEFYNMEHV